jgi:hypothetical protein
MVPPPRSHSRKTELAAKAAKGSFLCRIAAHEVVGVSPTFDGLSLRALACSPQLALWRRHLWEFVLHGCLRTRVAFDGGGGSGTDSVEAERNRSAEFIAAVFVRERTPMGRDRQAFGALLVRAPPRVSGSASRRRQAQRLPDRRQKLARALLHRRHDLRLAQLDVGARVEIERGQRRFRVQGRSRWPVCAGWEVGAQTGEAR